MRLSCIVAAVTCLTFSETQHHATPRELLLEARSQLTGIPDHNEQGGRRTAIARWLAWAALYEDAAATQQTDTTFSRYDDQQLKWIRSVNNAVGSALPPNPDDEQLSAVGRLILEGKLAEADSAVAADAAKDRLEDEDLVALSEAYYRHGNERDALRLAREVKHADPPDFVGIRVEKAIAGRQWDSARAIIRANDGLWAAEAMVKLARAMALAHDTASAAITLTQAIPLAAAYPADVERLDMQSDIANAQYDLHLPPTGADGMVVPDRAKRPHGLAGFTACDVTGAFAKARRWSDAYSLARMHCYIWSVAGYQFRAGDLDGALRGLSEETNHSAVTSELSDWVVLAAKRNDLATARRVFATIHPELALEDGYIAEATGALAYLMAASEDVDAAVAWSRARPTPDQRVTALVGVARLLVESENPRAKADTIP